MLRNSPWRIERFREIHRNGSQRKRLFGPGQPSPPIWPCSTRGFPCLRHCCRSGGLLRHLFTLTRCARPEEASPRYYLGPAAEAFAHRRSIFCGTFRSRSAKRAFARFAAQPPGVTRRVAQPQPVAEPRSLNPVGAQHAVPFSNQAFGVRTFLPPPLARLRELRANRRSPDSPAN